MKLDIEKLKLDSTFMFLLKKHRGLEIEDIEKIQTPEELFDIWCEWGELLGSGFGPRIRRIYKNIQNAYKSTDEK